MTSFALSHICPGSCNNQRTCTNKTLIRLDNKTKWLKLFHEFKLQTCQILPDFYLGFRPMRVDGFDWQFDVFDATSVRNWGQLNNRVQRNFQVGQFVCKKKHCLFWEITKKIKCLYLLTCLGNTPINISIPLDGTPLARFLVVRAPLSLVPISRPNLRNSLLLGTDRRTYSGPWPRNRLDTFR